VVGLNRLMMELLPVAAGASKRGALHSWRYWEDHWWKSAVNL